MVGWLGISSLERRPTAEVLDAPPSFDLMRRASQGVIWLNLPELKATFCFWFFRRFMKSSMQDSDSPAKVWAVSVALALVCLAVFWPVRGHDFVNYDDNLYVTDNATVLKGLTVAGVKEALVSPQASNWHPLTMLSHMADVELFGVNPGAHHLVSVVLHACGAALLLVLLHGMTGCLWRSMAVASLFALHPLRVESVAWIAERKDVLCGLFWVLTCMAYAAYARKPSKGRLLGVCVAFAMGIMTKPMIVTLPFTLLLLDVWPLNRLSIEPLYQAVSNPAERVRLLKEFRARLGGLVLEKIPMFALAGFLAAATFLIQRRDEVVQGGEMYPFLGRLGNAAVAYVGYGFKTIWPRELPVYYPHPGVWPIGLAVGAALLLLGVTWLVVKFGRSRPWLPVGWFWFVGTLFPVIGLIQVGGQSMANRYTYTPSIGLFLMAVWGIGDLSRRWPARRRILWIGLAVCLSACVVQTRRELGHWRNSVALFSRALEITGDAEVAGLNLGQALQQEGRVEEAIGVYLRAIEDKPEDARLRGNLGQAFAAAGRNEAAKSQFEAALRLEPRDSSALNNLGNLLVGEGRPREALAHLKAALEVDPDDAETLNNLGLAHDALGRVEEAVAAFRRALALRPDFAFAWQNLGLTLAGDGRLPEAVECYRAALAARPEFLQAETALGMALAELGQDREALAHFQAALRLDPGFDPARAGLERVMGKLGSPGRGEIPQGGAVAPPGASR